MKKPRHVSIFLPRDTPFYRGLLPQMRRGFEQCGLDTSGACELLDEQAMHEFCERHRPDLILEMNRPRCEAPFIPKEICHAVWVVDFNGRELEHFKGSELTYLFGTTWETRYPHSGLFRWMGPGTCPETYYPREQESDFDVTASFIGHIPKPWSDEELGRRVVAGTATGREYSFGDLLIDFEPALRQARNRLKSADDFIRIAESICLEKAGGNLKLDDRLRYDITGRVIRHLNRCDLTDELLSCLPSGSPGKEQAFALYGPENWAQWPKYKAYYRGFLETPDQMRRVFQQSRFQLHEGNGIHFRSMDAMASGALLFFRKTAHDHMPGGILSHFQPHRHFVPFDLEDSSPDSLRTQVLRYLEDPTAAQKIREAGRAEVLGAHTWKHRAEGILDDYGRL